VRVDTSPGSCKDGPQLVPLLHASMSEMMEGLVSHALLMNCSIEHGVLIQKGCYTVHV